MFSRIIPYLIGSRSTETMIIRLQKFNHYKTDSSAQGTGLSFVPIPSIPPVPPALRPAGSHFNMQDEHLVVKLSLAGVKASADGALLLKIKR